MNYFLLINGNISKVNKYMNRLLNDKYICLKL